MYRVNVYAYVYLAYGIVSAICWAALSVMLNTFTARHSDTYKVLLNVSIFAGGSLFFAAWLFLRARYDTSRPFFPPCDRDVAASLVLRGLAGSGASVFYANAVTLLPLGEAGTLIYASNVFAVPMGYLILGEGVPCVLKITFFTTTSVTLVLVFYGDSLACPSSGTSLVPPWLVDTAGTKSVHSSQLNGRNTSLATACSQDAEDLRDIVGKSMAILCAFCNACGIIVSRRLLGKVDWLQQTVVVSWASMATYVTTAYFFEMQGWQKAMGAGAVEELAASLSDPDFWAVVAYCFGVYVVAIGMYNISSLMNTAATSSFLSDSEVAWAFLFGFIFLGQQPSALTAGCGLIVWVAVMVGPAVQLCCGEGEAPEEEKHCRCLEHDDTDPAAAGLLAATRDSCNRDNYGALEQTSRSWLG